MHLLFVCTGNICRSPTAERLTRAYAAHVLSDPRQLTAASAGTRAVVGHPIHPSAVGVLQGLGGDPTDFVAQYLDERHVQQADLVLTMAGDHRRTVLGSNPRAMARTFTLREAVALLREVSLEELPDPSDLTQRGKALVARLHAQRAIRRSTGSDDDIADPIGRDQQTFVRVGNDIAEPLLELLGALCGVAPAGRSDPRRQDRTDAPR